MRPCRAHQALLAVLILRSHAIASDVCRAGGGTRWIIQAQSAVVGARYIRFSACNGEGGGARRFNWAIHLSDSLRRRRYQENGRYHHLTA